MAEPAEGNVLTARWALRNGRPTPIRRDWDDTAQLPVKRKNALESTITRQMRDDIESALGRKAEWLASLGSPADAEAARLRAITGRSRGPVPRKGRRPAGLKHGVAAEYHRAKAAGERPVQAVKIKYGLLGYSEDTIKGAISDCRKDSLIPPYERCKT